MKVRSSFAYLFIILSTSITLVFVLSILQMMFYYNKEYIVALYGGAFMLFVTFVPSLVYWFTFYVKIDNSKITYRKFNIKRIIKKSDLFGIFLVRVCPPTSISKKDNNYRLFITFIEKNPKYPNDKVDNNELIKWLFFNDYDYVAKMYLLNPSKIIDVLKEKGYAVTIIPEIYS